MHHTPDRPDEPRPTEPAPVPPPRPIAWEWDCPECGARVHTQPTTLYSTDAVADSITQLWHQYRDEEREAFQVVEFGDVRGDGIWDFDWDSYATIFKRFPSFPDWLRKRWHLGRSQEESASPSPPP